MRRTVTLTLFCIMLLLFAAAWLVFRSQKAYPEGALFQIEQPSYAIHGTKYAGTGPAVLYTGDENLDRYGNSAHAQFHTGILLARFFKDNNRLFIHYDQRQNASIAELALDLSLVLTRMPAHAVLAHGQGCWVALAAAAKYELKLKKIILTGCQGQENYAAFRHGLMLRRMQLNGASEEILRQAQKILEESRNSSFSQEIPDRHDEPGIHLLYESMRKDLASRGKERLLQDLDTSWALVLSRSLQKKIAIYHFQAEYDVFSPLAIASESPHPSGMNAGSTAKTGYMLRKLPRTDYFLREANQARPSALELALHAGDAELSQSLKLQLGEILQIRE